MEALDVAGGIAVAVAALNAGEWSGPVWFAAAVVFLWRAERSQSVGLLLLGLAGATLGTIAIAGFGGLPFTLLAGALVVLTAVIVRQTGASSAALLAFVTAAVTAIVATLAEAFAGRELGTHLVLATALVAGVGLLVPKGASGPWIEALVGLRFTAILLGYVNAAIALWIVVVGASTAPVAIPLSFVALAFSLEALGTTVVSGERDAVWSLATRAASHVVALAAIGTALASLEPLALVAGGLGAVVLCFAAADASSPGMRRGLRVAAHALSALLVGAAFIFGLEDLTLALGGVAVAFLWRSIRDRSFGSHLLFLFSGSLAALLASLVLRDDFGMAPAALLAVLTAFSARVSRAREGLGAHARLTLGWAIAVGFVALFAEFLAARPSLFVYGILWAGTALAVVPAAGRERSTAEGDEGLFPMAMRLAHLAGALFAWNSLAVGGVSGGARVLALAVWAGAHLLIGRALVSPWPAMGQAASSGVTLLSGLTLLMALDIEPGVGLATGAPNVAACVLVGAVALVRRAIERRALDEHLGAAALSEALVVFGMAQALPWLNYYVLCASLYLFFLVTRLADRGAPHGAVSWRDHLARLGSPRNLAAAAAVAVASLVPAASLVATGDPIHLLFVSAASVILIPVLIESRAHALWVWVVCVTLLGAASWTILLGPEGQRLWLYLAIAGSLVIAGVVRGQFAERGTERGHPS
jgi:hypothetical protein